MDSGPQKCTLVVLVHGDTDSRMAGAITVDAGGDTDQRRGQRDTGEESIAPLVKELDHRADVVITVDPLSTGLAADVHGEVRVVHWTDALSKTNPWKRVHHLQFKITENTALSSRLVASFNPLKPLVVRNPCV